jgi:hypothetical protein
MNTEQSHANKFRSRFPIGIWICALLVLFFCLLSSTALAKKADYQAWLSAGARAKVFGGLYIDGTVMQRSELTFTDVHQYLPKVKVGYKVFDFLSLEAGVRYAYVVEDGNQKVRLFQDIGTGVPLFWIMKLGYRLRFQQTHNVDKDKWTPKIRNKVGLSFGITSLFSPGVYYEHFINTDNEFGEMGTEYRLGLVMKSKITKSHRLKVKLFQEAGLNGDDDLKYVCEVAYRFHF